MRKILILLVLMTMSFSFPVQAVANDFHASWWCRGAHLQTIYGGLFRENPKIHYRRERVELPDGDFLDLDWAEGEKDKPVVLILHGLASSSESSYIKVLVDELHQKGWNAAVMSARGQSGEPNRLKVTNHAGRSQDVDAAVKHIINVMSSPPAIKTAAAGPSSGGHGLGGDPGFSQTVDSRLRGNDNLIIYAVGYSLGGNMLLKWLGENAGFIPPQVRKAVAVSVPYDLELSVKHLDTDGFNREVYVRSMLNFLKPLGLAKEEHFPGSLNRQAVESAKTFKVYDREVTAKLNGFKDEIDYWTKSSSKNYMGAITVPTLLIHAANDPFLPGPDLPYREMLQSPNLKLLLTEDGGHLGFVSGESPLKPKRWLEKKITGYFLIAEDRGQ